MGLVSSKFSKKDVTHRNYSIEIGINWHDFGTEFIRVTTMWILILERNILSRHEGLRYTSADS